MLILLLSVGIFAAALFIFLQQPSFGKAPTGKRLERILKSPHYKKNKFENIEPTPQFAEGTSMPKVMLRFLFGKNGNLRPVQKFNFTKTDLKKLDPKENIYVWMGHSSYFMQLEGKRILVDPVFSGNASPVSFTTKSFAGTDLYTAEDMPLLDYLIITHDHWDHLEYKTVQKLIPQVKQVITGLGTGAHLEYWGYDPKKLIELDWFESADLGNGFRVYCETARHFSGRGLTPNQAIWASFVLESPKNRIYIGGDSGYGSHFKAIGEKYGSFNLAILENGQYNVDWPFIHFLPGQNLKALQDLKAKKLIPVHNSKFALAGHSWKEPLEKLMELNTENLIILTPKIGEKVNWQDDAQVYQRWWEGYK